MMASVPIDENEHRLLETLKKPAIIAQQWSQCKEYNALKTQMYSLFKEAVPLAFKTCQLPQEEEEQKFKKLLLSPLEWYIFGGDPEQATEELRKNDKPPQLCGHVFKSGEPNYSCRDCALDPTCVLCIDCFQRSGHKKHRYRMNTSSGGGYCDCGDVEAWTSDPACEKHQVSSQQDQDPLEDFSEELIQRASFVIQILLNYCNQIINSDQQEVLPEELRPETMDDSYCTMLFNDEVHTYDQVIEALRRAVNRQSKEALELATIVDKEGRTSVMNAAYRDCEQAKGVIVHHTSRQNQKPLKVLVMHSSVVAHQTFALKLMEWFMKISSALDGLRHLVCQKLMLKAEGSQHSIIEMSMFVDSKLWKAARTQWHELFMSTMLLDAKFKKEFGVLLTKHYKRIQWDFAQDDHDHSFSVTAITVQIYTVPTMGLILLKEHSLLKVICQAFLDCTADSRDASGKYVFSRGRDSPTLRRIMYSLTDIRYVLSNKPTTWDATLREKTMEGLEPFLEILKAMHGMDSVVRAVGHHIEYDPDWETGIQLHIHMKLCINLFLDWCTSDRTLLIRAYRATMKVYRQAFQRMAEEDVTFAGHTTTCFRYQVSHRPVSVHYALSRFLAGLQVGLGKFNLSYLKEGLLIPMDALQPIELIEEPLRVQVLVAELHAGMWRRNGYSLVNQTFFYKNVKCREEMYDRDIQMLQAGAALMEPDDFILCALHRFELVRFLEISGGDGTHAEMQEILGPRVQVMEEFLHLLINILCERYLIGVGEVEETDGLRREVLHLLCINTMAHSELVKNLPENHQHETGVEDVIPSIANYKKPTRVTENGKYELKKECLKEYSPYYYHYTRSEQSKSEEQHRQRLDREGIKDNGSLYIPQLPPRFSSNFKPIIKLLDCKMFISLLKVVFHRAVVSKGRLWTEDLFQKALYLVGLALLEEERSLEEDEIPLRFTDRASRGDKSLVKLVQGMVDNPKVKSCTDLLNWIFKKFDEIRKRKGTANKDSANPLEEIKAKDTTKEEEEKRLKAEMAKKRREHLMAQMSAMQKSFIRDNPELFEAVEDDELMRDRTGSFGNMDVGVGERSFLDGRKVPETSHVIGPNRSPSVFSEPQTVTCILCQEEERVSFSGKAMVYATFVQSSSVLSNSREKFIEDSGTFDPLFSRWDLFWGCHARTCGHVMHATCWQGFFEALVHRERRRVSRFRGELNYDISKNQFLCPLCETLSNTVLPILPPLVTNTTEPVEETISMEDWLKSIDSTLQAHQLIPSREKESSRPEMRDSPPPPSSSSSRERRRVNSQGRGGGTSSEVEMSEPSTEGDPVDPPPSSSHLPTLLFPSAFWEERHFEKFFRLFSLKKPCNGEAISGTLQEMLKTFSQAAYTVGLKVMPDERNERISILSWNVCAYTVQSTETMLRVEEKPLFGSLPSRQCDTLRGLIRHATLSSWLSNAAHIQKHVLRLLSVFSRNDFQSLGETPSILDIDVFTLLVSLSSGYSALYQKEDWHVGSTLRLGGPVLYLHLLKLCFTLHLVQILLTADIEDTTDSMEQDHDSSSSAKILTELYCHLHQLVRSSPPSSVPKAWTIQNHLQQASLPFLRCCALYFHFLTSVPHPVELEQSGVSQEFELLCKYLALPADVSEILDFSSKPVLKDLIDGVCIKPAMKSAIQVPRHFPLKINQLITLPEDYMDLMNDRSLYVCPRAGATQSEGRAPALCLICGTVVCSQSYCCQVEIDGETIGACSAHAIRCCEGTGIFLRVRECMLLLMASKNNSCSYVPPYVDEYGEPDHGLRRGNPLYLSPERYQELQKMWISHDLPAEVTRRLESNNNLLNFPNI